jgi:hypothetical protein
MNAGRRISATFEAAVMAGLGSAFSVKRFPHGGIAPRAQPLADLGRLERCYRDGPFGVDYVLAC